MQIDEFLNRLQGLIKRKGYTMRAVAKALDIEESYLFKIRAQIVNFSEKVSEMADKIIPWLENERPDLNDDTVEPFLSVSALEKEMQEARERNRKRIQKLSNPITPEERAEIERPKAYWEIQDKPLNGAWPWTIHKGRGER